jgi:1-acyl-sn-glycerol-3-phosphate acyltransferase
MKNHSDTCNPYSGPHPWQINPMARKVRQLLRDKEYFQWAQKYCTPLRVTGQERLTTLEGPAIFIANHQSHMDTPVIMSALPAAIQNNLLFGAAADRWFVKGKKKLILQPWYQSLALGNFPIVRGGGSKTLDYAKWLLDQQTNICIFPEGTRATKNQLGKFKAGVAILALQKQVPIVPIVLKGLSDLRPKGSRTINPGPVGVTILEPIYLNRNCPDENGQQGVEASIQLLWETMNREFNEPIEFPRKNQTPTATKIVKAA